MLQNPPATIPNSLFLASEEATSRLGECLATLLRPGDSVLLDGRIGAGKTHLARAIIQARLPQREEVPSPTFTLVQTYDTPGGEIWHATSTACRIRTRCGSLVSTMPSARPSVLSNGPTVWAAIIRPRRFTSRCAKRERGGGSGCLAGGPDWSMR